MRRVVIFLVFGLSLAVVAESLYYDRRAGMLGANNAPDKKDVLPAFPGTLRGVTAKSLMVEVDGENKLVFHVDRKTLFLDGEKKVAWSAFREGQYVVVEGRKSADSGLLAVRVHTAKAPPKEKSQMEKDLEGVEP